MRNKKAKKLRKEIYGDMSQEVREYRIDRKTGVKKNTGLRAIYLEAKKIAKKSSN